MEVVVLEQPDGDVVARGSYYGGPDYEFIISASGPVYFRVVGDTDGVWAGPDSDSFRLIAAAWNRYRSEVGGLSTEAASEALYGSATKRPGLPGIATLSIPLRVVAATLAP